MGPRLTEVSCQISARKEGQCPRTGMERVSAAVGSLSAPPRDFVSNAVACGLFSL